MNAINRIAHLFPTDLSVLFRDFHAHVDGFVLIAQNDDDLRETSARVEVFETEDALASREKSPCGESIAERSDSIAERLGRSIAAHMIPVRCGQRFRVWNQHNTPVTLCFLPTERPHEFVSLDLFTSRD